MTIYNNYILIIIYIIYIYTRPTKFKNQKIDLYILIHQQIGRLAQSMPWAEIAGLAGFAMIKQISRKKPMSLP